MRKKLSSAGAASLPPALQTQSTAVLAHVAADLKSQVSRVLAGGSLGRAQIDWPAVSKAFTEQSTAEAAAVFSPQLFSTAVLEACTGDPLWPNGTQRKGPQCGLGDF